MMIRNLPEDLVVEILSRVPAVSLTKLRLISKEWNAMIKNGIGLDKKHFANAPRHSKALVLIDNSVYLVNFSLHEILNNVSPCVNVTCQLSLKDPLSNNSPEQVGILNVFHCDGLLLCTTIGKRLVVWNPCTGETMWIQPRDSYETNDCYALGRSSCNKYKILRQHMLHDYTIEKRNVCEIFWQDPPKYTNHEDFEYEIYDFTSNSWRGVVETTDLFIPRISSGMYVNGVTYWFDISDGSIVSFDFSTERFGSVDIPEFDYPLALSVTGQGQQLCMLSTRDTYVTETNLNLWIATKSENTGETSWSKFPILQGHGLRYRLHFRQGMKFLAYQVKEEIVVVSCNAPSRFSENIIHGVARHKFIELVHHGEKPRKPIQHKSLLLSYIPSLVQIQQYGI